jgi:hypothetical protein
MAGNAIIPHRIYLSHAAADRAFAARVADRLRAGGIAVLTDSEVEAGRRWGEAIENALARANACLVLVSKASNPSDPSTSTEWARIQDTIWRRPDLKVS